VTAVAVGRDRSRRAGGGVIGGALVAYRGELFKLLAQRRTWLGVATAAIGPIIYLLLELAQGPPGAPLANNLGHTGVGFSLVVFKLIAVFGPAVISSLVAGDIVASEVTDGTLKTALTRSITRTQLLLGKLLALYTYLLVAIGVFFLEHASFVPHPDSSRLGERERPPARAYRACPIGARGFRGSTELKSWFSRVRRTGSALVRFWGPFHASCGSRGRIAR
jgi:hypothetical protein